MQSQRLTQALLTIYRQRKILFWDQTEDCLKVQLLITSNLSLENQRHEEHVELTMSYHTDVKSLAAFGISCPDAIIPHVDSLRFDAPIGRQFKVSAPNAVVSTTEFKNKMRFLYITFDLVPLQIVRSSGLEYLLSYEG